jgi:sigma-B regulation protein RsbU (phosphoserine phosphatase)
MASSSGSAIAARLLTPHAESRSHTDRRDEPAAAGRSIPRILIVDDDLDTCSLLRARVMARGYEAEIASDGETALAILQERSADLVFLDVAMSGMNGLDVLEQIRSRSLDVAVVLTTAFGSEEIAVEALRRGANDYLRKPFDRAEFHAVLDRTIAVLALARQNRRLRQQLNAELARAAEVQTELLPREYPRVPGFEVAARCLPARQVGGDFYDWQLAAGCLGLTVGDVMGKGIPAALLMATVRAVLRATTAHNPPAVAMQTAAAVLATDLDRSGAFATIFHAQLDVTTGSLRYVDAGHGHVLLLRADGTIAELRAWALPLGVNDDEKFPEGSVMLEPGDVLVIYSDGLTEAQPDLLGSRSRLAAHVAGATDAVEIVDRLVEIASAAGALPDDLTIVALRRCEPHPAPFGAGRILDHAQSI